MILVGCEEGRKVERTWTTIQPGIAAAAFVIQAAKEVVVVGAWPRSA